MYTTIPLINIDPIFTSSCESLCFKGEFVSLFACFCFPGMESILLASACEEFPNLELLISSVHFHFGQL